MLRSTHKQQPLPPGWTEHRAPSGHLYYYNAESKKSTYTRPSLELKEDPRPIPIISEQPQFQYSAPQNIVAQYGSSGGPSNQYSGHVQHHGRQHGHKNHRRPPPADRPKHKQSIPGAEPWLLIRTKLRRRFVHNPETGESLWKFPADVMRCVVELDRADRDRKEQIEKGIAVEEDRPDNQATSVGNGAADTADADTGSDEYEEVEVTEDEDEDEQLSKRQRTEDETAPQGPVEFGEDDIAFQLAQMEAEAAEGDDVYDDDAPQISDEDARALFMDLLDDFRISPFTPWDTVIAEGRIIDDDRYTVLPNMKSRKEVFDDWSRTKAAEIKEQREKQAKQDPRIPYMAFLSAKATPKLYWQEFRRKHLKEPEMKDRKLTDKEREKWYREHITRLKLSESDRKRDLRKLLEEIPVRDLNKSTSINSLPGALLRDIRFISLPPQIRDPLVEAFIEIAPPAPESDQEISPEEEERRRKEKVERERREKALADRERAVREQQEIQRRALGHSKNLLREEEAEVRRAMRVGREGLLSHLKEHGETKEENE